MEARLNYTDSAVAVKFVKCRPIRLGPQGQSPA